MAKRTPKGVTLNKAESHEKLVTPSVGTERGQPRIITSGRFIQDAKKVDLIMPQRLCTFDRMCEDDAVYTSIDYRNLHVVHALSKGQFVGKTEKGKTAANFLNYNIRNMTTGTWMQAMINAATDLKYGFSLLNIVTEVRDYGKFKGNRVLKKLAPRDQKSVYGWLWDKNFREVVGFVQRPLTEQTGKFKIDGFSGGLTLLSQGIHQTNNYPVLKSEQLLHFKYNSTNNNPQGDPPLLHVYDAWAEKKLVEKYEVIGVSKDLGGLVVLRVPQTLIERANQPDLYPAEAEEYKQLQEDAASIQAGESTYIILTSDTDADSKQRLFDFDLKGIEGGGKQYSTSDIIDQKRKSIYNVFGAGFLLLGQNESGSYALSTSSRSTHEFYVQRDIVQKTDVINNSLAPKLLAINDIFLDWEDMPEFIPADPNEFSLDELSKVIQRMKSVGGITKEAVTHLYEKAGLPLEGIDELIFDDGDTSRGGESNGSSGVGNSQNGGASSATNNENGGVVKSFVIDYETDTQIFAKDVNGGAPITIDKEE